MNNNKNTYYVYRYGKCVFPGTLEELRRNSDFDHEYSNIQWIFGFTNEYSNIQRIIGTTITD